MTKKTESKSESFKKEETKVTPDGAKPPIKKVEEKKEVNLESLKELIDLILSEENI